MVTSLSYILHVPEFRVHATARVLLAGLVLHGSLAVPADAGNWPMRQRDAANTGRADFDVPSNRKNNSFFDAVRWQTPSPGSPNEGRFSSGTMVFFDGAGPNGADLVVGGYHWPKGVQGMDRHTGKRFWFGNPDGGESIAENTPAFSNNGTTIYVVNDSTSPDHPLMGFSAVSGPASYRHNGSDPEPWKLGRSSPKIGPDDRIYVHHWSDRPHGATDSGAVLTRVWSAQTEVGTCYNVPQIWQDTNRLIVVSAGRYGQVKAWDGSTGAELWSATLFQGTDADATIDPASGKVFLPLGSDSIRVAGLDKNGNPLCGTVSKPVFAWQSGVTDPQRAQSAGCLSHDGLTYYFQTVSPNGQGKLYAIKTADGSLKWSFATGSRGWERTMSSPIVTANGVIVVGNNEGGTYYAILDNGTGASLLDTLAVADAAEARSSATVSADGLLYLSGRWPWTVGNGDLDTPTQQAAYLFTAFDLNAGVFGLVAPEITRHPLSQTVEPGTTATLSVGVAGNPGPALQWYLGTSGDTSQPISGATSAIFTTPALTATATYWVLATNSQGVAASSSAVVTVRYAPEIVVEEPIGTGLASGATRQFGNTPVGTAATPLTFAIRNTGNEALANLAVHITGNQAADFAVNPSAIPASLAPNAQTEFTVTFTPGATGPRTATLSITSNDTDENPFVLLLSGTGIIPLAGAVDQPALLFVNGGAVPWFGQTAVTHDGISAARSGSIGHSSESWMSTDVTGPGTLSFWWKVSSEGGYDFLEFYLDGVLQSGRISGEVDWQKKTYAIPEGSHGLRWRYRKDNVGVAGQDAAWVDQVVLAPPTPPQIIGQPLSQTIASGSSAILSVAANVTAPLTFQWYLGKSGDTSQPLSGATAANFSTPGLTETASFWVRVTNTAGSADSAAAVIQPTPVPVAQVDLAAGLVGGLTTVTTSTLDIGSSANIFDGNTSTLVRTQAVNPMVVTLQFQQPLQLARSRIFFGSGRHRWTIDTADTLPDLNGATGSFHRVVDRYYAPSDQWNDSLIPPGPQCRFVRLTLNRLTGDSYVHLFEWQLFSGTAFPPTITTQPQSILLAPGQSLSPEMVRVSAAGTEPLSYQWARFAFGRFDAGSQYFPLFPGQAQLALGTADAGDEGIYQVTIVNDLGQTQSQEIVVGVNGVGLTQQDPDPEHFQLQVGLEPSGVDGGWRFEGDRHWRASGSTATGLAAGRRKVVFKPVPGLVKPPDEMLDFGLIPIPLLTRIYQPGDPLADTGSLSLTIEPADLAVPSIPASERAQWRLVGEGDAHWSDSGTTRGNLPSGDYLIEYKPLAGREPPDPVHVTVLAGETCQATAIYPPLCAAAAATWIPLEFATMHTASGPTPYACVGRVDSDQGEGTGVLVNSAVVLTDATLVFDDVTLSFVNGLTWTAERHRDLHEPNATAVGNVMLMAGYVAQRTSEGTPGQLSPASGGLGVAALRLETPEPRFTGYLASDLIPHAWLASAAAKRAVGYPSLLAEPQLRGRMHESEASQAPLSRIQGGLYAAAAFGGGTGMRGAPLFVRHGDGRDYPAAIFVGSGPDTVVRAIDFDILRLLLLASAEPVVGSASISQNGGATLTSWIQGSNQEPAVLSVQIGGLPDGTIGSWRIGPTGSLRRSGDTVGNTAPGSKQVYFPPVAGFLPPGDPDPAIPGGGYLNVDLAGGRKYLVTASYWQFTLRPSSRTAVAGQSASFNIEPLPFEAVVLNWYHNGQPLEGQSAPFLSLFPITSPMAGSYTAKISYGGGEYWTPPAMLTVTPAPQTVQWTGPQPSAPQEALPFDLAATSDSGLPVQFEVVSGPATVSGVHLTPTGAGTVVVRALQPGDADSAAAQPVTRSFEFVVTTLPAWRFTNFGTTENTGNAADNADPDGDAQNNLAEFTSGTNPRDGVDFLKVLTASRTNATSFTVTANGKAGRTYVLERIAESGGAWQDIATTPALPADAPVVLTDAAAPPARGIYRLKVVLP